MAKAKITKVQASKQTDSKRNSNKPRIQKNELKSRIIKKSSKSLSNVRLYLSNIRSNIEKTDLIRAFSLFSFSKHGYPKINFKRAKNIAFITFKKAWHLDECLNSLK
jgi:RNA recognition motif-containing protein